MTTGWVIAVTTGWGVAVTTGWGVAVTVLDRERLLSQCWKWGAGPSHPGSQGRLQECKMEPTDMRSDI